MSDTGNSIPKDYADEDWILPNSGILQFFIDTADDDSMYGRKSDELGIHHNGDGYCLVLHEEDAEFDSLPSPPSTSQSEFVDMDLPFDGSYENLLS